MGLRKNRRTTFISHLFLPSEQIRELVPESQAYMDLLAFERKLDQTIMRKRVDIQEALKRPMKVRKINHDLQVYPKHIGKKNTLFTTFAH